MSINDIQATFNTSLGISAADIQTNKQGQLSERQRADLQREINQGRVLFIAAIVVACLILVLAFLAFLRDVSATSDPIEYAGRFIGMAWLIIPLFAVVLLWKAAHTPTPLSKRPVTFVEGQPNIEYVQTKLFRFRGFHRFRIMKIGEREFHLDQEIGDLFEQYPTNSYRIYYPKDSGHILSVEVLA